MILCGNKNTKEYKELVANYGESQAQFVFDNLESGNKQIQHIINGTGYVVTDSGININGIGLLEFPQGELKLGGNTYLQKGITDKQINRIKQFFNTEIFNNGKNYVKVKYNLDKGFQTIPITINNAIDFDKVKESVEDTRLEELQGIVEDRSNDFIINEVSLAQEAEYRIPMRNEQGNFTDFFSPLDEKEIVDSIFSDMIFSSEFVDNRDISKDLDLKESYDELLDSSKVYFESLVYDELDEEELAKIKNIDLAKQKAQIILNSWNDIEAKVRLKFDSLGLKIDKVEDEQQSDEDDSTDSENNEIQKHIQESIEIDPVDGLAQRIKLFLSFIPEVYYDKNSGEVRNKYNQYGLDKLYDFKKLYTELSTQFANRPNLTFNEIVAELKSQKDIKPIFYKVAERLEDRNDIEIKKQFVQALKKNNLGADILNVKKNKGDYEFYSFQSNKSGTIKVILDGWREVQLNGTELFVENENGQRSISVNRVAYYQVNFDRIKELQKLKATDELLATQKRVAKELLNDLGIDLQQEAWNELYAGLQRTKGIKKYRKSFSEQFGFNNAGAATGLFSALFQDITGVSKATENQNDEEVVYDIMKNNPLYNGNEHKDELAILQSRHKNDIVVSSRISIEGKQIYDFINPSFEQNEINKLLTSADYRKELKNDLFAGAAPHFDLIFNRDEARQNYKLSIFEGLLNKSSRQERAKTRTRMSDREQLIASLALYINKGSQNASFLELTKSDKTVSPLHTGVKKLVATRDDTQSIKKYFKQIIDAELERVKFVQENKNDIKNKALQKGGQNFYFVHLLNKEYHDQIIFNEQGEKVYNLADSELLWNDNVFNSSITSNSQVVDILLDEFIELLYNQTQSKLKELNIDNKIIQGNFKNQINSLEAQITSLLNRPETSTTADEIKTIREEINKLQSTTHLEDVVMEYALNTWLFNASISMLFSGDPAIFYKPGNDINSTLRKTYNEYGKRQAKDNASGSSIEHTNDSYISLVASVAEIPVDYLTQYTKLKAYESVDTTDAIQYVTAKRYIQLMRDRGRISQELHDSILSKIDNAEDNYYELTGEETNVIFGPEKPVEVFLQSQYKLANGKNYRYPVYVKSAIFPLIPQLTRGFEMDKVRTMMETNGIDQLYMSSAGKAGNIDKPLEIFKNGKFNNTITQDEINYSKQDMKSEGFLFQQEVPFDEEKEKITFITQLNKLVTDTIAVINDKVFEVNNEKYNGLEISLLKEEIRKEMIDYESNKLKNALGVKDGKIDNFKLRELIIAKTSNITLQEQQSLEIGEDGEFITPLFYNPYTNRFQSALMSLIKKSIQPKMAGKSFVQASALGINKLDNSGTIPSGIIPVGNYNGETLKMPRVVIAEIYNQTGEEIYLTQEELNKVKKGQGFRREGKNYTGKMLPAQVLLPFNFLDQNGRLDITKFMTDGRIDNTKLPKELLRLVGARIPNQSHSSQLPIEIVGFLNMNVGDTIYVPDGITKQMGSDFDVDKLYVYKPNYSYNGETIEVYTNEEQNSKVIQDKYFNILYSILNNPAMFEKVLSPLDMKDMSALVEEREADELYNTYHSSVKQLGDFSSNAGAKSEVGTSSLHLTNESLTQRTQYVDFAFRKSVKGELIDIENFTIYIGNIGLNTFSGIGKSNFRGEERTNSQNIIIAQSAAVDHAKDKLIDKININADTDKSFFAFTRAKERKAGNTDFFNLKSVDMEPIVNTIASDIVKDYVQLLNLSKDEFAKKGSKKNLTKSIIETLGKKYSFNPFVLDDIFTQGSFTIQLDEIGVDQGKTLKLFLLFDAIGQELFTTIASTNQDTKGAGTSILEAMDKRSRLNEMTESYTYIKNRNELLQSPYSEETELSKTIDATLGFSQNYIEPSFGYQKLEDIFYQIKEIKGAFLTLKERKQITEHYKKFIFSNSALGIWTNPQDQRNRLLFGENSLAKRLIGLRLKYPDKFLFKKLQTKLGKENGSADYITYNTNERELDQSIIYSEFFDLSRESNPELQEFLKDLLIYNYVVQGNTNGPNVFTQLIPPILLSHNKYLKDIETDRFIKNEQFVRQVIQHIPTLSQSIDRERFNKDLFLNVEYDEVQGKPQFVYVQDGDKQYVYEYWNEQNKKLNYFLIGKLGSSNTNEYNYDVEYVQSSLPENFVPRLANKGNFEKVLLTNPYKGDDQQTGGYLVTDKIDTTLNNILRLDNIDEDLNLLAGLYKDIVDNVPVELRNGMSSYYSQNHSIAISAKATENGTVENILHETSHALTVRTVEQVLKDPILAEEQLGVDVVEAVFKLDELREYVIDKLVTNNKDKKQKAIYQYLMQGIDNANSLDYNSRIEVLGNLQIEYPEQIRLIYGTKNIKEFITHVLTNRDFQSQIKDLRDTTGRTSVLDRLKEWFSDFIKALKDSIGSFRSDSVLVSAINNAFKVIEKYPDLKPILDQIYNIKQTDSVDLNLDSNHPQYQIPVWYDNVVKQLRDIYNQEPLNRVDDELFTNKRLRLTDLLNNIEKLKDARNELAADKDAYQYIFDVAMYQRDWIRHTINASKLNIDDITYVNKLIKLWKDVDQILYDENDGNPMAAIVKTIIGEYASLEKEYRPIAEKVARGLGKVHNIPMQNAFRDLVDVNQFHYQIMELNRSPNNAVQLLATLIDSTRLKMDAGIDAFSDRITALDKLIKDNKINTDEFINDNTFELHTLINDSFSKEWNRQRDLKNEGKEKGFNKKEYVQYVKDNVTLLDLEQLFEVTDDSVITRATNEQIEQLAKNLYSDKIESKNEVIKFIKKSLEEQRQKLQTYHLDLQARVELTKHTLEELQDANFSSEAKTELNKWIRLNNPYLYKGNIEKGEYSNRSYLTLIPKGSHVNSEYVRIMSDEVKSNVLTEIKAINKDLLKRLPNYRTRGIKDNFIPAIHNKLIDQQLTTKELIYSLKDKNTYYDLWDKAKGYFTAVDYTKNNETLEDTLRYINDDIKSSDRSKNLIANLFLFGKMAYHYSYFNEVRPSIYLIKDLIENVETLERNQNGDPVPNGTKVIGSTALPNTIKMINTNLSHIMYLNRTKPDIPLPFTRSKPNFDDLYKLIAKDKKDASNFELVSLVKEEELVAKVEQNYSKPLGEFRATEELFNFYMEQIDEAQAQYDRNEISREGLDRIRRKWFNRLSLLNGKTFYGSKITDTAIKYKRLLTMGFSPFSGFTNLLSGTVGGYIYASSGVDFNISSYNQALQILLTSWKGIQGKSDLQAKKLRNLAVMIGIDKNLIDTQGIKQDNSKFDEVAYLLMSKSENFGKMALATAYLLHNQVDGKSLWDSFDENANWIGEDQNWTDRESKERIALNRKLLKITGQVMGTTGIKMLNQTGLGRLVAQFRLSWLPEAFAMRFEEESYDAALGRSVKGRYRTWKDDGILSHAIKILQVWKNIVSKKDIYSDMKYSNGKQMSQVDIENLRKNATEALFIVLLMTLVASLKYLVEDDDDRKKIYYAIINQALLLERDLTSVHVGTLHDLISGSLIPSYSLVKDYGKFIATATDYIFTDEVEQEVMFKRLSKIVPGMSLYNKFLWQTESLLDD